MKLTGLLATWTVAFIQAQRTFRLSRNADETKAIFLVNVDKATMGLMTALAGTPYV